MRAKILPKPSECSPPAWKRCRDLQFAVSLFDRQIKGPRFRRSTRHAQETHLFLGIRRSGEIIHRRGSWWSKAKCGRPVKFSSHCKPAPRKSLSCRPRRRAHRAVLLSAESAPIEFYRRRIEFKTRRKGKLARRSPKCHWDRTKKP